MPDISKCNNEDCPLSWNCWRFNCPPDIMQSYTKFTPDKDGECQMYYDMDDLDINTKKRNKKK